MEILNSEITQLILCICLWLPPVQNGYGPMKYVMNKKYKHFVSHRTKRRQKNIARYAITFHCWLASANKHGGQFNRKAKSAVTTTIRHQPHIHQTSRQQTNNKREKISDENLKQNDCARSVTMKRRLRCSGAAALQRGVCEGAVHCDM